MAPRPVSRRPETACAEGKPDFDPLEREREAPLRGLRHEPLPQLSLERRLDEGHGAPKGRPGREGGEGEQEDARRDRDIGTPDFTGFLS